MGALLAIAFGARAQNPVKVGVIAEFSGPFAAYGQQIEAGMKAYMKQHGDTVAGKKIELITRDTGGPAPDVAKRFAQELSRATRCSSSPASASRPTRWRWRPWSTEAKVPMIVIERGDVGDHHALAVHRARVDDDPAGERADGRVGAEERRQAGVHGGGRLRPRHRRRNAVHEDVQGRRRRGRRHAAHAAAESGLLAPRSSG